MGPLNGCYVRIKKHPVRWVNPLKIIVEISRNYHASVLTLHSEMKDPWTSKICIQTPPPLHTPVGVGLRYLLRLQTKHLVFSKAIRRLMQ